MNRHEYREEIVTVLYQHLLLKKDLSSLFADHFENDTDPFFITLKDDLLANNALYIEELKPLLHKWTFERLNYVDQAILLLAISEIKTQLNNKNIVIDEAINIAKKYCDDESYKYINGVLDRL